MDTLKLIFGNIITDPATGDTSALPAKYERWWMEGAMEKLFPRIQSIDPNYHRTIFEDGLNKIIKRDANSTPGDSSTLASHRPMQSSGVDGPSFPANFDVLP